MSRRASLPLRVAGVVAATLSGGCAQQMDTAAPESRSRDVAGARATAPRSEPRAVQSERAVLRGVVERVIDGDTVRLRVRGFQDTARLVGIDTPETRHPRRGVECFGPEASVRMAGLLPPGTTVRIESDPNQGTRDRYGRFLGFIYRGGTTGVRSVNYAMVAAGYARSYVYDVSSPHPYAARFAAAERLARARGLGLWGPPCNGRRERRPPGRSPAAPPPGRGGCDPNYAGACIPPPPPDLDCGGISERRFSSVGADPHRFDEDGDGVACEG